MRLAANARIIVQCFLERLPFVLEDHTVWMYGLHRIRQFIRWVALKAVKGRVARRQQV
jgi:hypothetical protein